MKRFFFIFAGGILYAYTLNAIGGESARTQDENRWQLELGRTGLLTNEVANLTDTAARAQRARLPLTQFGTGFHLKRAFDDGTKVAIDVTGRTSNSAGGTDAQFGGFELTTYASRPFGDALRLGYAAQLSSDVRRFAFDFVWQKDRKEKLSGAVYNVTKMAADDTQGWYVTYEYEPTERFGLYARADHQETARYGNMIVSAGFSVENDSAHTLLTTDFTSLVSDTGTPSTETLVVRFQKRFR